MKTVLRLVPVHGSIQTERICLACQVTKPFSEFQKDVHGYMQKKARCRECCNKKQREVDYPKNKRIGLKNRPDKMRRVYGVTYNHVIKTLISQLGRCANIGCSKEISLDGGNRITGKAVIDHNHETGKFRAVLCSQCNLELGKIEKDTQKFLGLMDYLTKYN